MMESSTMMLSWDELPVDLWACVFQFLSVREHCAIQSVCLSWEHILKNDSLAWLEKLDFTKLCADEKCAQTLCDDNRSHLYHFDRMTCLVTAPQQPPISFGCFTRLKEAELSGCQWITAQDIVALVQSCGSTLESLDLYGCVFCVDDAMPTLVAACSKLNMLVIGGTHTGDMKNEVTDRHLELVATLQSLRTLTVNSVSVTDGGIQALLQRSALKSLHLCGCSAMQQFGHRALPDSLELETLHLCHSGLRANAIHQHLHSRWARHHLVNLSLAGTNVSETDLLALARNCSVLRYLNVKECTSMTDEVLLSLCTEKLSVLVARGCYKLTDAGVSSLDRYELSGLNVAQCTSVTTDSIVAAVSKSLRKLEYLNVQFTFADNECLSRLASMKFRSLRALSLGPKLNDDAVCQFLQSSASTVLNELCVCGESLCGDFLNISMPNMRHLSIAMAAISATSMENLTQWPCLESLQLFRCMHVTHLPLNTLRKLYRLRRVSVRDCPSIPKDDISNIDSFVRRRNN